MDLTQDISRWILRFMMKNYSWWCGAPLLRLCLMFTTTARIEQTYKRLFMDSGKNLLKTRRTCLQSWISSLLIVDGKDGAVFPFRFSSTDFYFFFRRLSYPFFDVYFFVPFIGNALLFLHATICLKSLITFSSRSANLPTYWWLER